ncbi:hypothetical protein Hanom_Chr07g00616891 [Helianthus anomalus]
MVFKDYTKYLNNYYKEIQPRVYYIFIQSAHFEKQISSNKLPVKRVFVKAAKLVYNKVCPFDD